MFLHVLLLLVGVFFCSTAIIWIKLSTVSPVLLAGLRCLIASVILSPLYLRDRRRFPNAPPLHRTLLPGFILAIHFMSWIIGARAAGAANASLIVNMVPVVMPLILFVVLREKLSQKELVGTIISVSGLVLLGITDFNADKVYFKGDVICFFSMIFFAIYLVLARRNSDFPSLWLYVVPMYAIAGLIATFVGLPLAKPLEKPPLVELALVLCLAVLPTVLGHTLLNFSMKKLRGQLVALANLCQFVFAGTMAYLISAIGEKPAPMFYPAAALVILGVITALQANPKPKG